jgi:hypothetical protein
MIQRKNIREKFSTKRSSSNNKSLSQKEIAIRQEFRNRKVTILSSQEIMKETLSSRDRKSQTMKDNKTPNFNPKTLMLAVINNSNSNSKNLLYNKQAISMTTKVKEEVVVEEVKVG